MENMKWEFKMLGVVTLYNPDPQVAAANILRYLSFLDKLIIWDNSPIKANLKHHIFASLQNASKRDIYVERIEWRGNGENLCIAPAINFAWHYAEENGFDLLLIMDQDSQWNSFKEYRKQVECYWKEGKKWVFTPYFKGYEFSPEDGPVRQLRVFINSGTIIPTEILTKVGGADERLPLDAALPPSHRPPLRPPICISTSSRRSPLPICRG